MYGWSLYKRKTNTRLAKLRDGFIKRNANEAEMKQLDELEGVIDNQIEK